MRHREGRAKLTGLWHAEEPAETEIFGEVRPRENEGHS